LTISSSTTCRDQRIFATSTSCWLSCRNTTCSRRSPSACSVSAQQPTWVTSSPTSTSQWKPRRSTLCWTGHSPAPCVVLEFLGLAGYYRCFIQGYGTIVAPLTALPHKDGFRWTPEVEAAFRPHQRALTSATVVQLPDFDRDFTVECDMSGSSIDSILHQSAGSIAFCNTRATSFQVGSLRMGARRVGPGSLPLAVLSSGPPVHDQDKPF
jgi:hypothetical protein